MSNMTIEKATMVAIDFESTGERKGWGALPIQVGMVSVEELNVLPHTFFRSHLHVQDASGSKEEQPKNNKLQEPPTFLSLWPIVEQQLRGRYLVAHGRGTEKRFLRAFPMHGFGPWIDTLILTRKMIPGLPSYQLSDLITYCGLLEQVRALLPDFCWHEALSDALASLILLLHLIKKGELAKCSIDVLLS